MTKKKQKSWRDVLPVHPAADIFPMMSDQELRELGEDVKKNGLIDCVVLWQDNSDGPKSTKDYVVLDGRNRLEAMERAGLPIPTLEEDERNLNIPWSPWRGDQGPGVGRVYSVTQAVWWSASGREEKPHTKADPVAFVISANIRRRHLTKQQQAELIVKAVEATVKETSANMATVSRGKRGPAKDPVNAKVIEEARKNDISPRTAERALAVHRAPKAQMQPKRTFVTCPECSARVADLDKHLKIKHKSKAVRRGPPALETERMLEKAVMNTKEATARCARYDVLANKASLKKMLRLYDELEESISLGRDRINNCPSDKEIKRVLTGGTSIKKLGP